MDYMNFINNFIIAQSTHNGHELCLYKNKPAQKWFQRIPGI